VSTHYRRRTPVSGDPWQTLPPVKRERLDVAEQVALVARARGEWLLHTHRHRLRREELEDCLSQTALELIAGARAGRSYVSTFHLANVFEQRFLSRVTDRRRALSGRSPLETALEYATPIELGPDKPAIPDRRLGVEETVVLRLELDRLSKLATRLTLDQRTAIACQVALQMKRGEFCGHFGWSPEKYRKVLRRGRSQLRSMLELDAPADLSETQRGKSQRPQRNELSSFSDEGCPALEGSDGEQVGTAL
jgi:DNA-directed RNA polymerase specialized sigma24 family protein